MDFFPLGPLCSESELKDIYMLTLDDSTEDPNTKREVRRLELIKTFCHLLIQARTHDDMSWDQIDEIWSSVRVVGERKSPTVKD